MKNILKNKPLILTLGRLAEKAFIGRWKMKMFSSLTAQVELYVSPYLQNYGHNEQVKHSVRKM